MTPTILSFDTSGPHCCISLLSGNEVVAARYEAMSRGQSESLFELIQSTLDDTGAVFEELDAIAVGIGPGNFTGVRISVSAARGLSMSLGIPAIGVTNFEALAHICPAPLDQDWLISLPSPRRDRDVMVQFFTQGFPSGNPMELVVWENTKGKNPEDFAGFPGEPYVYGHEANALNFMLSNDRGGAYPFEFSASLRQSHAIGQVAAKKLECQTEFPAPSPLYIRPADAAPPKDPAPLILDK